MKILQFIPNLLTLGNLFFGILAINDIVLNKFESAGIYIVIAIAFDFFDGFAARILKVSSELGKQLDSLADVVTSGVAPGLAMYYLLYLNILPTLDPNEVSIVYGRMEYNTGYIPYIGLLLSLAACYRLGRFNISTNQTNYFVGLPTPAMSLVVISLPIIQMTTPIEWVKQLTLNNNVLIGITLFLSFLMNSNIKLIANKFKSLTFKDNWLKYLLVIVSGISIYLLGYLAVPVIFLSYLLLSVVSKFD